MTMRLRRATKNMEMVRMDGMKEIKDRRTGRDESELIMYWLSYWLGSEEGVL